MQIVINLSLIIYKFFIIFYLINVFNLNFIFYCLLIRNFFVFMLKFSIMQK